MSSLRSFLATTLLVAAGAPVRAQVAPRDSTDLVSITQSLLDAITSGDSSVWSRYLAPRWFLTDEEGRHVTRAGFLADLHPLPAGQHGALTVARPHLTGTRSVTVISYDADEVHDYYGQRLSTRFHVTDTYARVGRGWQQLASQVTALPTPIPGVRVADDILRAYVGSYTLTPDIELAVTVGDSGLLFGGPGQPPQPLFALDDRIFVRHGVRGFWVFERDSTDRISRLVNWRDNNAVVWRRRPR